MATRKPFRFHVAYCEGHHGAYGWLADGRTPRADTELVKRLELLMLKRPRSEIWKTQPPKTRQIIRLDVETDNKLSEQYSESAFFNEMDRVLKLKLPAIKESVIDGLAAEEKSIVWAISHAGVQMLAETLMEGIEEKSVAVRMRQVHAKVFIAHGADGEGGGLDSKARFDLARSFREHKGACTLVATIQSMPEAISLKGAVTEHFAQIYYLGGPMFQAEDRPYEKDVQGLSLLYYVARNTADERLIQKIIPRLEALEKIARDADAGALRAAFTEGIKLEDMWGDLLASMPDGDVDLSGDEGGT